MRCTTFSGCCWPYMPDLRSCAAAGNTSKSRCWPLCVVAAPCRGSAPLYAAPIPGSRVARRAVQGRLRAPKPEDQDTIVHNLFSLQCYMHLTKSCWARFMLNVRQDRLISVHPPSSDASARASSWAMHIKSDIAITIKTIYCLRQLSNVTAIVACELGVQESDTARLLFEWTAAHHKVLQTWVKPGTLCCC
jgi:hypothetical protein